MKHIDTDMVTSWINEDPDRNTAQQLTALLDAARQDDAEAINEIQDAFSGTLTFGTAGLRGKIGPGPHRMNRVVVIRTAAGLAAYLRQTLGEGFKVVIGYDARHMSQQFAQDTASVVTGAGGQALLFDTHCPTPVLAFALRELNCDAGVMVTASHNPPQDNGYKVYLGGRAVTDAGQGAQIVPPFDEKIAAHIAAVGALADVPMPSQGWQSVGDEMRQAYLDRLKSVSFQGAVADVSIVLTAMHGVGGPLCQQALEQAGFHTITPVASQFDPDPDFPTVTFPNPEEPGAMDEAFATARRVQADLIIANDPDADRCSVAIPDPSSEAGYRQLTGDEVGALLGEQSAELAAFSGQGVMANSIVSSRLLRRIAQSHGLDHRITLTGFKWISRVPNLVFGYEEALGYCVDPSAVRDKDGISASVRMAVLASVLKQQGRTIGDLLDRLARDHGLHATSPLSVRVNDLSLISDAMARLRHAGPTQLAGSAVSEVADLLDGASDGNGGSLPPTDGLMFITQSNDRVIVRPSGTEPKLKCYCEVIIPTDESTDIAQARSEAAQRLDAIKTDMRAVLGL